MRISVINHSNGNIKDNEIIKVIRAINRQIQEDFEPYWSMGATLRLEGRSQEKPNIVNLMDMRGDAIIYVWAKSKEEDSKSLQEEAEDAIGYHNQNFRGVPYSFVFIDVAERLMQDWSIALSHEALEMIADPEVNLLVLGPDPRQPEKSVFHYYEVCDAVSAESYEIDGIKVSNFVLPLYFTSSDEYDGRNDLLGSTLKSFGVNPGGYISYIDPRTLKPSIFFNEDDTAAQDRKELKVQLKGASRLNRYQSRTPKAYNI